MFVRIGKIVFFVFCSVNLMAQQPDSLQKFKPSGNVEGNVFSSFYYGYKGSNTNTAFQITRAQIGYDYNFREDLNSRLVFDVSNPKISVNDTISASSSLNYTAYVKFAYLIYRVQNLSLSFGIIQLSQIRLQDKLWTRRYIMKTAQDEYGFCGVADLGVKAEYKFTDWLTADFTVRNGEGYKSVQTDNKYWYGLGIQLKPLSYLYYKVFFDYTQNTINQLNISNYVGFNREKTTIGVEYIVGNNFNQQQGKNLFCISVYASYKIFSRIELFARYDKLSSNTVSGEVSPWNSKKDLSFYMGGVQFTPIKNIVIALNEQIRNPENSGLSDEKYLFFNLSFNF